MKYNTDPRIITAKFNSICAETEREIKKGEECIYYPLNKKVYHTNSKQATIYREWKMDIECLNQNY